MPDLEGNEAKYLAECISTGWVSSIGKFVERFESEFASFCTQPFAATVNSGTAAIHLALRVLNVGPGSEVILPALTFASTANCVLYQGATPVFADCSEDCWNLDPEQLEALINERTAAIMPVHLYGLPCEMDAIMAIAARHGIPVVEDCAEAHGAEYRGARVGSFGKIGCFSFYGNKIITTGEGGMCVTEDAALDERLRYLRDHGMNKERRYWHDDVGYNYRMTNLQAAVGCAQLERIDQFIERKRWIAEQYRTRLRDSGLLLPGDSGHSRTVYWLYTAILPGGFDETRRDELIDVLGHAGIDSRPFFYPLPDMPPYKRYGREVPHARSIASRGITLPSFHAMTERNVDRITAPILDWLRQQ
jgi:perosamine synthetase